jgi:hypothetical protein
MTPKVQAKGLPVSPGKNASPPMRETSLARMKAVSCLSASSARLVVCRHAYSGLVDRRFLYVQCSPYLFLWFVLSYGVQLFGFGFGDLWDNGQRSVDAHDHRAGEYLHHGAASFSGVTLGVVTMD